MLPRLWGNDKVRPKKNGSLADNGTGKFSDIDTATLDYLKWLGCSHVWYTGILRHSTQATEDGCIPSIVVILGNRFHWCFNHWRSIVIKIPSHK